MISLILLAVIIVLSIALCVVWFRFGFMEIERDYYKSVFEIEYDYARKIYSQFMEYLNKEIRK